MPVKRKERPVEREEDPQSVESQKRIAQEQFARFQRGEATGIGAESALAQQTFQQLVAQSEGRPTGEQAGRTAEEFASTQTQAGFGAEVEERLGGQLGLGIGQEAPLTEQEIDILPITEEKKLTLKGFLFGGAGGIAEVGGAEGPTIQGTVPLGLPVGAGAGIAGIFTQGGRAAKAGQALSTEQQLTLAGNAVQNVNKANIATRTVGTFNKVKNSVLAVVGATGTLGFIGINPFNDRLDDYQQSINTIGESSNEILQKMNDGRLDPISAIEQIEQDEATIALMEKQIQDAKIASFSARNSGEMIDVVTDINEKRKILQNAKSEARAAALTREFPEVNEQVLSDWLTASDEEELKKIRDDYISQLEKVDKVFGELR